MNERGREEAGRLAARLAHVPLAAIYASPRRRTIETAATVAARHRLDVQAAPALDEIDFGTWAGQTFVALDADPTWRHWNASRATATTPAGETMAAATGRALDHITALGDGGPVLYVSHCDIIRGVAVRVFGLEMDRLFAFDCDPASLTVIETDGDAMRLVTLNERPQ